MLGDGAVFVVGVFEPPVPVAAPDVGGPDGSLIIGFNLMRAQIGFPFNRNHKLDISKNIF